MKNHLLYSLMLVLTLGMYSCRADVDLANIDPALKLDMGLALPVGEISATIGDLLGSNLALGIREDGSFYLYDSLQLPLDNEFKVSLPELQQQFTPIQEEIDILSQFNIGTFDYHAVFEYASPYGSLHVDHTLPVQFNPDLAIQVTFDTTAVIMGNTYPIHVDTLLELGEVPVPVSALPTRELNASFQMDLSGFNTQPGIRIDSILVAEASFNTRLTISGIEMPFTQIEYVDITLDPKVFHRSSQTVGLPLDGANFGQDVPMNLGRFNLCLMANPAADPSATNILTQANVNVKMVLNCEPTDTIRVRKNPKLGFSCTMSNFAWDAIYGLFSMDEPISYESEVPIISQLGENMQGLKEAIFPMAEPRLTLIARSQIGIPVALKFNEIAMHDTVSQRVAKAEWNGQNNYTWVMPNFPKGNDPLDMMVENTLTLSSKPSEGTISNLFTVRPDKLSFSFSADACTDPAYTLQHRITPTQKLEAAVAYELPFTFGPGLNLAYADTFPDVNLSGLSLDSLLGEVEMIDSVHARVKAVIHVENMLPFNLSCKLAFLDQNKHEVKLQSDGLNNIQILKPTGYDKTSGRFSQPGTSVIVLDLTEEDLDKLQNAQSISLYLSLSDIDQQRQEMDSYPLKITKLDCLKLKLALTANASAYLNATLNGKED